MHIELTNDFMNEKNSTIIMDENWESTGYSNVSRFSPVLLGLAGLASSQNRGFFAI